MAEYTQVFVFYGIFCLLSILLSKSCSRGGNGEKRGVHDIKHATRALLHAKSILPILKDLNIWAEFTALLNNKLFYKALLFLLIYIIVAAKAMAWMSGN